MHHPLLFQANTRVLLGELGRALGRPATLDDLSDDALDQLAARGFAWLWLLGVWRTSARSREVSLRDPKLRHEAQESLPDLTDADIVGSPFAVAAYEVKPEWGGNGALSRLRARLAQRGLCLLLDFVPNHTGLDHPWLEEHPDYYVAGDDADLAREPHNYVRVSSRGREIVLAYGRDPFFAGWPDTLQLDYRRERLRAAMGAELLRVASLCDGVRCDMAMLLQPDVFARTWRDRTPLADEPALEPFWRRAIAQVKARHPGFLFIAEVYWEREWELQQEGFDYTYDKKLYDRLREGSGHAVREHLLADAAFQERSVRFLENHDEPRAAATFPLEVQRAAAMVSYLVRGLRFFHEGQLEGRRARVSMHVGRRPAEPTDPALHEFYIRLLALLRRPELHEGSWSLWGCRAAWAGNESFRQIIVTSWVRGQECLLVAVNYAPHASQCYVRLELPELAHRQVTLTDVMGDAQYVRDGDELRDRGLYLALSPWQYHAFAVTSASAT